MRKNQHSYQINNNTLGLYYMIDVRKWKLGDLRQNRDKARLFGLKKREWEIKKNKKKGYKSL